MKKKVSVIMSCYNEDEKYVKQAIESILCQSFENFEYIIILDNPLNKKIRCTIEKYDDKRIKFLVNSKNIGLASSLNKGISIAEGEYIARMDADDISCPNRLLEQVKYLENNPDVDIVSSFINKIDENNNVIQKNYVLPIDDKNIKKILPIDSVIVHPAVMFRKKKINKIGNYRLFPTSQDYDLWLRCMDANYVFHNIPMALLNYRIRNNSISNSNPRKQFLIRRYIQKLHKKRKQNNIDDFNIDNLNKYLKRKRASDEKKSNDFKKSINYYNCCKSNLKKKNIFHSIIYLIKATCSSRTFIIFFIDSIKKSYLRNAK